MKQILKQTKINTLFADGEYLYLQHNRNLKTVKMTYSQKLLDKLQSILEIQNFHYVKNNKNRFYLEDSWGRFDKSLSQICFHIYNGTSHQYIKKHKVFSKNGDVYDLTKENLVLKEHAKIFKHNNYIVIKDYKDNYAFTDYSEELWLLLNQEKWYFSKEFKTFISKSNIFLHQMCFVNFFRGANIDNFYEVLDAFRKENEADDLVIDHKAICKNGTKPDNTKANLQLVTNPINSKKSNITSKLQSNMFYVPVTVDEKSGAGEICGRINYKTDIFSFINLLVEKVPIYDVEFLPDKADYKDHLDNLRQMVKKDAMPEDSINIPISYLQYFSLGLKAFSWIATALQETKENKQLK